MFIIDALALAERSLKARLENYENLKTAKCVSISVYRELIKEIKSLKSYIEIKKQEKHQLDIKGK